MATDNGVKFSAGQQIYREGEPGGELLVIKSGVAEVYRERNGQRLVLAHVGTGEILGVMTATNGGPRTASVMAKTTLVAQRIPRAKVSELVATLPSWANALLNDLVLRVEQADALYVNTVLAKTIGGATGPLITLALKVAEGLPALVEALGGKDVNLKQAIDRLSSIIGEPAEAIMKVVKIFAEKEMFKTSQSMANQTLEGRDLDDLAFFAALLKDVLSERMLEEYLTSLAHSNRMMLMELVNYSQIKKYHDMDEVKLKLEDFEAHVKQQKDVTFDTHAIKVAGYLRILKEERDQGDAVIKFVPKDLWRKLTALEVLVALDGSEEEGQRAGLKRTLVY